MPRTARRKSETGIYHVMLRGINRQVVFESDEERTKFLYTLKFFKEANKYKVYAYCLMDNHAHLLIEEATEPIGHSIKRICASYVYWYNRRHDRIGHLFQERFKSEVVDNDKYFLTVLRYIHQNPIKSGITDEIINYRWSSYHEYLKNTELIDKDFVLGMFSDNRPAAMKQFKRFINESNLDKCLDCDERKLLLDSDITRYLLQHGVSNPGILQQMEKGQRDKLIRAIKAIDGVTVRQLSRVTGISKSVIDRV
ncbi:MAG: transposase [Syntrophomonadaceae bacterium]